MPYKCCVPGCRGNYRGGPQVHIFQFPKDVRQAKKWIAAICRRNFKPTKSSRVCQWHFAKEDLIFKEEKFIKHTGEMLVTNYKNPKLREGAVPSKISNCPAYLSKEIQCRQNRQHKLDEIDKRNILITLEFQNFLITLVSLALPANWHKVVEIEKVIFIKIINSPGPVITFSVVVSVDFNVQIFLYGREFTLTGIETPFVINKVNDIKDLLFEIEKVELEGENVNNERLLKHSSDVLDLLAEEQSFENGAALSFLSDQLKLYSISKHSYRYSNDTLVLASLLHSISPDVYKFLRHSEFLILPHVNTIKSLCNRLLTNPSINETNISLTYAKNVFPLLNEREQHVILLIDGIHIEPYINYKEGNIVGRSFNSTLVANFAFVFKVTSVMSNLKEVVYICSISKVDHTLIYSIIKTVIVGLEKIGYKVFCVLSDNSAINSRAMSNFAENKQLSIVYPHPADKSRPLFYIFDSIHLLKCIYNNWLNSKPEQKLHYPDFHNGEEKVASFKSLKILYQLKPNKLLKSGFSLNSKALYPLNSEQQNVNLALNIFNSSVTQALLQFGCEIQNSKETADFINIIENWWKIMNVKYSLKGIRLNDKYQQPIVSENFELDEKIVFLNKLLNWLDMWKSKNLSQKLTPQTHNAFAHTVYGMLEIIKYCFSELKMNYVLLGKFQTGELEHRFSK